MRGKSQVVGRGKVYSQEDLELDNCFALENSEFQSYAITIISLLGPWGIKIQKKTKKWKIDFHIKSEKEKKVETGNFKQLTKKL